MNNNYEFGMNQFAGMPEPYSGNNSAFTFDYSSYPHLMDANQQLPPAPLNLFNDSFPYQQHPVPPPPPHHASFTSGQQHMGQLPSSSLFSPPPNADYPPSNGSYPWSNTPPSAPAVSSAPTSASPQNLRPNPLTAAAPAQLTSDDQQLDNMWEFLNDFQQPPAIDNFYQQYPAHPQMQQPGYFPQHQLSATGGMYPHTDPNSIPSPYLGSGNDPEYSPPPSLMKPQMQLDDDDSEDETVDLGLDMKDLAEQLPEGVTEGDLTNLKIPDLNKKLKNLGLSRDDQNHVKRIRRQYKNRGYAHTCRKKKDERKSTMKEQKQQLQGEIDDLKGDVERLRIERDKYKNNYEQMQQRKQA